MDVYKILVINPGSTSTKIAVFENEKCILNKKIEHPVEELSKYERIIDQYEFRKEIILKTLEDAGIDIKELSAVVGRGGLLYPLKEGGTYKVNELMLEHLRQGVQGEHASNLGALIANAIAKPLNIPAFIVDPVVVDEMEEIAKISGLPEITRRSIFHALNQKYVARLAAKELGKKYEECNLIVAHMGGGISIGAHKKGKVIDVNNALNGDGPFSPERAGGLPAWDLIQLALSGKYTKDELKKKLAGKGGMVAYLGTNDFKEVKRRIAQGDKKAKLIYDAMVYQIAKEIGALAAALKGEVDAIVLTGGLANEKDFTNSIKEYVKFIAKVMVFPGEKEMEALAMGALRVLRGEEKPKEYKGREG